MKKRKFSKEFQARLDKEGIIETPKKTWFSGGMKIYLMLRGNGSNRWWVKNNLKQHGKDSEWYKQAKLLAKFEREHKIRLSFNDFEDLIEMKAVGK